MTTVTHTSFDHEGTRYQGIIVPNDLAKVDADRLVLQLSNGNRKTFRRSSISNMASHVDFLMDRHFCHHCGDVVDNSGHLCEDLWG